MRYAVWSPVGNRIAFVRGNAIYIWEDGKISQITDSDPDVFNGVPDFVYEEGKP